MPLVRIANYIFPSDCNTADGSFTLFGTGGTPPYSYSIDGGVTFSNNNVFTNLVKGQYNCLLKDAYGLLAFDNTSSIDFGTVTDSTYFNCRCCPFLSHTFISTPSSCLDSTGILELDHPWLPGDTSTYTFSIDGVHYFPADTPFSNTKKLFYKLNPGLYTGYVKSSTGYVSQSVASIAYYCRVAIRYTTVAASCQQNNGAITIHAVNGRAPFSYTIDGVNYQTDSVFTGLGVGTYNFSVKDADGAINSSQAVVYNRCPLLTATATNEICNNRSGTISAIGSNGTRPYSFSIDSVHYQTDSLFTNLPAATYTVFIKDFLGFIQTTIVNINNYCLSITATVDSSNCSKSNGTIRVQASNGLLPYQFSKDRISFSSNSIFSNLAAGSYTVYAKDATTFIDSVIVTINDRPGPRIVAGIPTPTKCIGDSGTIQVKSVNGTLPFSYTLDNTAIFQNDSLFTGVAGGNHIAKVRDNKGCLDSIRVIVPINNTVQIDAGNDTSICKGGSISLQAQSNSSNFSWLPVTGLSNATSANPIVAPLLTTMYHVYATLGACSKSDSVKVSIKPLPLVNIGNDTILCEDNLLQLNAAVVNGSYQWQDGSTNAIYTVSQKGLYYVKVIKDNCASSDTIQISYQLKPRFTLGANELICQTQSITLHPLVNAAWQLHWQDGSTMPTYIITQPGNYYLDASNACGTTRDEIIFTKGLCKVYVPSAFSPDGNNKNDVFKAFGTDLITDFHLQIFNRYGQIVFETSDKNKGWDGKISNQPGEQGNYIYILQYKENNSAKAQILKGSCLLIR